MNFIIFTIVRPLKFEQANLVYCEIHEFFVKKQVTSNDIELNITVSIC